MKNKIFIILARLMGIVLLITGIRMIGEGILLGIETHNLLNFIVFVGFGSVFSFLGFFLSGTWALIQKIKRKGQPEAEEELPPEEYINPEDVVVETRPVGIRILLKIVYVAVVLGIIMASIKFRW